MNSPAGPVTVDQAMGAALAHHQAGRLAEAEGLYRQVLAAVPDHPDALHFLGVVAHQVGRNDVAEPLIRRSIERLPGNASFHNNHGQVLRALGRRDDAISAYQRAADLSPTDLDSRSNLAIALREAGRFDESIAAAREAIEVDPRRSDAYVQLAATLHAAGQLEAAMETLRHALARRPGDGAAHELLGAIHLSAGRIVEAEQSFRRSTELLPASSTAHNNLGISLARLGRLPEAVATFERAARLDAGNADARVNLGQSLLDLGRIDAAGAAFHDALRVRPNFADALLGLSRAYHRAGRTDEAARYARDAAAAAPDAPGILLGLGAAVAAVNRLDEAIAAWRRVLELDPRNATAHNNIAAALTTMGAAHEGIAHYRQALSIDPAMHTIHSNMLLDLHYVDSVTPDQLFDEHREFARRHTSGAVTVATRPLNGRTARDPKRKLRVGYFSPDFRAHSVADFIAPLLAGHDRSQFEVVCYANVHTPDVYTERLKSHADLWRDVTPLSDDQAADLVREDNIDIMVDLAGHTAHGRILIFARKPAPIQLTYLGYPDTTGLAAVDYRITDLHADPPGLTDALNTERLLRLPNTAWCYHPYPQSPAVAPPPMDANGFVTFGSFNNLAKVTPATIALWARVLNAVPTSRLLLKAGGLGADSARRRILDQFAAHGIPGDRVELVGRIEDFVSHLAAYARVDVALDTYPYHGTTTTCEAFYMGVPVVTLAGRSHVSRVGVSLLTNVGLPDLVAADADQYVDVAARLAADARRLRELRATLRGQMERSPLMDPSSFVRDIERAYRDAWEEYCATSARQVQ